MDTKLLNNLKFAASAAALLACATVCLASLPTARYTNPTPGEFPIAGYHSFSVMEHYNVRNYRMFMDAGFNLAHVQYWENHIDRFLDTCAQAGVKAMLFCPSVNYVDVGFNNSFAAAPGFVETYKNHPQVAGFIIYDEPSTSLFPFVKEVVDSVISKCGQSKTAYVNLFPNYANRFQMDISDDEDYSDYVDRFISVVDPPMVSFDNYGLCSPNCLTGDSTVSLRDDYFENLEIISSAARNAGIPFWSFVRSTAGDHHVIPTYGQLAFQAFSGLAYGSQGITYYGYASKLTAWLHDPPIQFDDDGNPIRNQAWYDIKALNEKIRSFGSGGSLFLDTNVLNVWHCGSVIPQGCTNFVNAGGNRPAPIYWIDPNGAGVVASHFVKNGTHYLMLVNKDWENSQRVRVGHALNVSWLPQAEIANPGIESTEITGSSETNDIARISTVSINPGSAQLFYWQSNEEIE